MTGINQTGINVFWPVLRGSFHVDDMTAEWWPSYSRQSEAIGGDWVASATFAAGERVLEEWIEDRLGYHVEESYLGLVTFAGYIHTMRLNYNGLVIIRTLDGVYNKIAVWYKPDSGTPVALTSFSSDGDSVATYGTRELMVRTSEYMSQTVAETLRDKLLVDFSQPSTELESINLNVKAPPALQVEVRGYVRTLDGIHYNSTSMATDAASDEITDALSGADFVTAGDIETNNTQVAELSDYRPTWQRLKAITRENSGAGRWIAGCYGGRSFDYSQANVTAPTYYIKARGVASERGVIFDEYGAVVPPATVMPGRVAFVRDVMGSREPSAVLLDDPRAFFIESLTYTNAGLVLKGAQGGSTISGAVQLALQAIGGR